MIMNECSEFVEEQRKAVENYRPKVRSGIDGGGMMYPENAEVIARNWAADAERVQALQDAIPCEGASG